MKDKFEDFWKKYKQQRLIDKAWLGLSDDDITLLKQVAKDAWNLSFEEAKIVVWHLLTNTR